MDMIRHKAVCPDFKLMSAGIMDEQFQVARVVFFLFKDHLAVIAPLGYMMGII